MLVTSVKGKVFPQPNSRRAVGVRVPLYIGVGRFRILGGGGGQGLEYWYWGGWQGGPNSQQAHDVVLTSMRRHFDAMCPLGF